ncbi:hypothetical protein KC325_g303 [Hortaea werneckii]|nr:hypothetical protein KC325_g303 [Hortaea werneckii]
MVLSYCSVVGTSDAFLATFSSSAIQLLCQGCGYMFNVIISWPKPGILHTAQKLPIPGYHRSTPLTPKMLSFAQMVRSPGASVEMLSCRSLVCGRFGRAVSRKRSMFCIFLGHRNGLAVPLVCYASFILRGSALAKTGAVHGPRDGTAEVASEKYSERGCRSTHLVKRSAHDLQQWPAADLTADIRAVAHLVQVVRADCTGDNDQEGSREDQVQSNFLRTRNFQIAGHEERESDRISD